MTKVFGDVKLGLGSDLGAPALGGVDAAVLAFPAFGADRALTVIPGLRQPDGVIESWALGLDLWISKPASGFASLLQLGGGDGELFLRDNGDGTAGLGIAGAYHGAVAYETWTRLVATVTVENGASVLRKYVDGALVGTQDLGASTRWQVGADAGLRLLTDNDGETAPGFLANVFFTQEVPDPETVAAALAAAPGASAAGFFPAQPSPTAFELNFAGDDLSLRYGAADAILEGAGYRTPVAVGDSVIGFASQLGIEGPGGVDAPVLKHPAYGDDEGMLVRLPAGAPDLSSYTMVWDLRVGALTSGWHGLLQTDTTQGGDGEFFINPARGIGIGGNYDGVVPTDQWTRIAITVQDQGDGTALLKKYLDGALLDSQSVDAARFTLNAETGFLILTDNDGETSAGYLAHFAASAQVLDDAAIAAMGGADADGPFPADAPLAGQIGFDGYAAAVEFGFAGATLTDATPVAAPEVANPIRDMLVAEGDAAATFDLAAVFGAGATGFTVESSNDAAVAATLDGATLTLAFGALGFSDLTVTATDAAGRTLTDNVRVRVAGEGAYSIAILPDTQDYTSNPGITATFGNMTGWIADNAAAKNIGFVVHVGDITQTATAGQFEIALAAMDKLRAAGIPFSVLPGNHDIGAGGSSSTRTTTPYNAAFSAEYMSQDPTFAGAYDQEPDRYDNNYHLWTAPDGTEWVFLNLEFGPRDDVLRWADDVLAQFADRKAMVSTHSYNNWEGRHDALGGPLQGEGAGYDYGLGNDPRGAWDGETLWRDVLSKHANVVFTAGGHIFGDGAETVVSYNQHGEPTFQFLVNYQNGVANEANGAGDSSRGGAGGNGAIRIVTVDPVNNAVYTETYFTEFDEYFTGARETETLNRDGLTGPYVGHEETLADAGLDRAARAVADAGDDQVVATDGPTAEVALSAARTANPAGAALAHVWTDADGRVVAEGAEATVTLGAGVHDLTLTTTAPDGAVSRDAVRVIVQTPDVWLVETFNDGDADGWVPPAGEAPALAQVGTDLGFTLPSLAGVAQRTLTLSFDSHWRPEDTQTAQVLVSIDGAAPAELLRYDSQTTVDEGADQNARVTLTFRAPASAQSVELMWKMSEAGNDWFWAVDNVALTDETGAVLATQDFDSLAPALQPAVDEAIAADVLGWTREAPEGWAVDTPDSVPQGAAEWRGWSFTTLPFWTAADGQDRANFTRAGGVFAVADPDEWDDFNGGSATSTDYETTLRATVALGGAGGDAAAAGVARIGALAGTEALFVDPAAAGRFDAYTLIYDLYVAEGQGTWTSLLQTDLTNASDGELFIRDNGAAGGVGISGAYTGAVAYDAWNRLAFAFSVEGGAQVLRKYVNGVFVGQQTVDADLSNGSRWTLDGDAGFHLFSDNDGDVSEVYAGAFAFTPEVLTADAIAALGGADADGPLSGPQPEGAFQFSFDGALGALDFGSAAIAELALGASGSPMFVKGSAASRAPGDGLAAPEGALFDQSNGTDNYLLWKDGDWSDLVVQATLTAMDDDVMGVAFRYVDADTHYLLTLDAQSNLRRLIRVEGGVETVLAEEAGGYRFYDAVDLKLSMVGGVIRAALDGVALFGGPVVDADPLGSGTIALYASEQRSAIFDDVVVRAATLEADAGPDLRLIDWDRDGLAEATLDGRGTLGAEAASWSRGAAALSDAFQFGTGVALGRTDLTLTARAGAQTDADGVAVDLIGGARLLAADRFEDGEMAGWTVVDQTEIGGPADWAVVDGALVERSGAYSRELTWAGASHPDVWQRGWSPHGDGVWALHKGTAALWDAVTAEDFSVEARIEAPTSGGVGLVLNWLDGDNHYKLEIDDRVNLISLVKVEGGYEDLLVRVRGNYTAGEAFHLRAERVDGKMQAFIDGHALFAEPVEDRNLAAGKAGVYAWGAAGARFDDAAIVDLTAPAEVARLVLSGTAGRDRLTGTAADEVIVSGGGRGDIAVGGRGADVFLFGAETRNGLRETDTIRDYRVGVDALDLGDATVARHVQSANALTLILDGDGDSVILGGVRSFEDVTFL